MDQPEHQSPFSSLFFLIYVLIRFLITVGEIVKTIIIFPLYLGKKIKSTAFKIISTFFQSLLKLLINISNILRVIGRWFFSLPSKWWAFLKQLFFSLIHRVTFPKIRKPIIVFHLPPVHIPKATIPKIALPKLQLPKISLPTLSLPKFSFPKFHFQLPKRLKKQEEKKESIIVPEITNIQEEKLADTVIEPPVRVSIEKTHVIVTTLVLSIRSLLIFLGRTMIAIISFPYHAVKGVFNLQIRYFILGFLVCLLISSVYQTYLFAKSLPSPKIIGKANYPISTIIYDRNGVILYEVYHDQNRTPITLKSVPPYIYQASIAIEDKDFFNHDGVAIFSGVFRAIRDMSLNKGLQGGSTITQQLVKSALLSSERTIDRKIREIILAIWTERLYTKNQILEMYLNQVPYGGSAYGIEEASKLYFGKSAHELTIAEAALVAGLPQAPSLYSPFVNLDAAMSRRSDVLEKMYEQRYITKEQKDEAINSQVTLAPMQSGIKAPHFVFYVKDQLQEQYGVQKVEEGGLRVTTTLDMQIQKQAETVLAEELDKVKYLNITNGAILVTRPTTGEILAMVGSSNYFAQPSGSYNDTLALRQPGSSVKPFTYALAMEKGYTAATIIDDSPIAFTYVGAPSYVPVNYDGKFHGKVPLRIALANSFNIPAVKTLQIIGVPQYLSYTSKLGITTWTDTSRYGLSLTLGGAEVRMIDMATAFGVFANQGYRVDLTPFDKIETVYGSIIQELDPQKIKVMNDGVSYIISDILSDNFARQWEFGTHSALEVSGYKVSVKTGTTDNKKDNWTIGYTPEFLVAVWVGNNDNKPMNQALASGISGAAPIWNRTMNYLLTSYSTHNTWFEKPNTVVEKTCFYGKPEYFIRGTENKITCSIPTPTISPTPSH